MKFKFIYIFVFLFLFSCVQNMETINVKNVIEANTYYSKGFALIYDDSDFKNKILKRKLYEKDDTYVLHSSLKNNTLINISNPQNSNSFVAKVKKTSVPSIYRVVITKKMADSLQLDRNNPYVEVYEIRKNAKFIAKEASIYEEERKVANKAPIDSINIDELSSDKPKIQVKKKPLYRIDIAQFYYYESAQALKERFENVGKMKNINLEKLSENKFRLSSGTYNSFNDMKETFYILIDLGFEDFVVSNVNK